MSDDQFRDTKELSQNEINSQIEKVLEEYHYYIMDQYDTDEELYDYETKGQKLFNDETYLDDTIDEES